MASESYIEKLRDPRWQRKRLEILSRDEWSCRRCHDTETTLNVHHRIYRRSHDPWDYEERDLVTLCEECHKDETEQRPGIEQDLLRELNRFGFFYDDIHSLMCGLGLGRCGPPNELLAAALEWLFETPDAQHALVDAYFAAMPHRKPTVKTETVEP